jgi:hypothetical protein
MPQLVLVGLLLFAVAGCAAGPPYAGPGEQCTPVFYANPTLLPSTDPECVWENVVDVVDDYFQIEREERVRLVGNVMTEGRLDTFPTVGSTILEPWRHDSANRYEKLESTLQTIRRRVVIRVIPAEQGFWANVTVFKELEDVRGPSGSTTGNATFRHDATLTRVISPVQEQEVHAGWIPLGRDTALEQRILEELLARFSAAAVQ